MPKPVQDENGPNRLRIASTGLRGIPGVMGGIETHCEELYPRIVERDPAIELTVLGRSPYLPPDRTEFRGVAIRRVWTVRHKFAETLLHTFLSIAKARFSHGFGCLHIHAIGPGILIPFARLLRMRVVLTHHGADYNRLKWGRAAKAALRFGERMGVQYAHRVITVSRTTAEELKARFPDRADRIVHIPNGASLPETAAPGNDGAAPVFARLGVTPGQYILAVGRLVPEKAHDLLIEAHRQSGSDRKLLIVGGADFDDDYSRGLLAKASDRVILAGILPRAELAALYREAHLFVLPSFHEGLPIVALEAIHAGTPVLLSDIGPNRELGCDESAYFRTGDIGAMAAALSRPPVPMEPERAERLKRRFDWEDIAARTAAVFRAAFDPP